MTTLTNNYIVQYIIPAFQGIVHQNFLTTVYDIEGNIILTSQKLAQALGYESWENLRGINFNQLKPRKLNTNQVALENQKNVFAMLALRDRLSAIRNAVVHEKQPISLLLIHPFNELFENFLILNFSPLFSPDGAVVAVYGATSDYSMFGMMELREALGNIHRIGVNNPQPPKALPFKLTARQHEIFFLMVLGTTQELIAELLNITRGTVTNTITKALLPKFNLAGMPLKIFVETCRKQNFQYLIPPSLCRPRLIILNREIAKKYSF